MAEYQDRSKIPLLPEAHQSTSPPQSHNPADCPNFQSVQNTAARSSHLHHFLYMSKHTPASTYKPLHLSPQTTLSLPYLQSSPRPLCGLRGTPMYSAFHVCIKATFHPFSLQLPQTHIPNPLPNHKMLPVPFNSP